MSGKLSSDASLTGRSHRAAPTARVLSECPRRTPGDLWHGPLLHEASVLFRERHAFPGCWAAISVTLPVACKNSVPLVPPIPPPGEKFKRRTTCQTQQLKLTPTGRATLLRLHYDDPPRQDDKIRIPLDIGKHICVAPVRRNMHLVFNKQWCMAGARIIHKNHHHLSCN